MRGKIVAVTSRIALSFCILTSCDTPVGQKVLPPGRLSAARRPVMFALRQLVQPRELLAR